MGDNKIFISTKYLLALFLVFTVTVSSIPLSYADRLVNYQTVANVKEESLVKVMSDGSNYPQIFPSNVRYVKILDNKTNLVEMNAGIDGVFFDTQAIYKHNPDGKYTLEVISGDLKGTTMTTELKKTWSFDGKPGKGTIADVSLDLKTSGFLSWILGFVPDSSLSFALENGFARFVEYAKSIS
jgi:hypothetical protein